MLICIPDVLTESDLLAIRGGLADVQFVDGKETASGQAQDVKNNLQVSKADPKLELLRKMIFERLHNNEIFPSAVRPKAISYLLFSKYEPGMIYGTHVDNPMMGMMRTDVSFTVFLSDPETYDGGELVIETVSGEQPIKLKAGAMVAYPSTTLHRVTEVTRGERLAAVGWIRSFIREASRREILFDLDTVRKSLKQRKDPDLDSERMLLMKTVSNLFRMWSDD